MSDLLPSDIVFRPMQPADVPAALAIIKQHSIDDYDVAKESYRQSIEGQYVLERRRTVIGVRFLKRTVRIGCPGPILPNGNADGDWE